MKLSNFTGVDWPLMIAVGVVLAFSLITLFSINPEFMRSQLIFLGVGVFVFLIATQLNYSILRYYSIHIYVASIIILTAVLFLGTETRGSVRWIEFLGFRIQFSEILKPFLALSLASYLSNLKTYSFKPFILTLTLVIPVAFLIFLQPDLGNSLIYILATLGILVIYGYPARWFLGGFALWLLTLPFFWFILHDYQRHRILTFINPSRDPLGTSYNAIQAIIAVGSGMVIGRGLGQGTQAELHFLPEMHTDFIFSTISEELGFVGSLIVITAFSFISYRIYIFIKNAEDKFAKMFSSCVFLIIFLHFLINIGMNIGILPIVGVTLPFVSYGGSSLLSNFILLGLLFAVNRRRRQEALEIR